MLNMSGRTNSSENTGNTRKTFKWMLIDAAIVGGIILTPIASVLTSKMPRRLLGALIGVWLIILNVYGLMN